jgi:hypothetical protein
MAAGAAAAHPATDPDKQAGQHNRWCRIGHFKAYGLWVDQAQDETAGQQADYKCGAPQSLAFFEIQQTTKNAADTGNPAVKQQQHQPRNAKQNATDK